MAKDPEKKILGQVLRPVVNALNRRESQSGSRPRRQSWWHLQNAGLFDSISEKELQEIASASRTVVCRRRDHLHLGGDEVYLLATGVAKLCRAGRLGRRLIDDLIGPGDLFGRVSPGARTANDEFDIEALEKAEILIIPRAEFSELIERHPDLAYTVIQRLEDRERVLRRRLESLVFKDVTARVAETLVELVNDYGEPCPHGMAVDVRITQQDLADLVGASRQMVNRVIRRLTVSLYVVRIGRVLCILHYERLCRLATGE